MSRVVCPALTAAVSNAGAFGMVAIGRTSNAATAAMFNATKQLTDRPFGAGFIVPFLDRTNLEIAAEHTGVIEFFYGWPTPLLVLADVVTGWQVGSVDEARAAVEAGCRYVIAQGFDGGGHIRGTSPIATLLPAVREAVDVPVVAAGGLGTPAQVKAAFEMGADAVRIGTRFLGAAECDIHDDYFAALIAANADDAVLTDAFDVGWPDAPVRALRSSIAAALQPGPDPVGYLGSTPLPRRGTTPPNRATTGEIAAMALYAGRSVAALTRRTSAADIIDELLEDQ